MSDKIFVCNPAERPVAEQGYGPTIARSCIYAPDLPDVSKYFGRHCERSEAIQLFATAEGLDCFAALAMTVATSLKAHPPATARYFAWGCFRYFGCKGV